MMERALHAGVAELVDALDLGSSGKLRGGSSPPARTNKGGPESHLYSYGRWDARPSFSSLTGTVGLQPIKKADLVAGFFSCGR